MKIQVQENIKDITLKQYLDYGKLKKRELPVQEYNRRKIMIFTKLTYNVVESIEAKEYEELLLQIDKALTTDYPFEQTYEMNGVKYGFHPNIDYGMKAKEWADLQTYTKDDDNKYTDDNLHKVMAILYRPITKIDKFGNYKIEGYKGTSEHSNTMLDTPMSIVNGTLVFFLKLKEELLMSTQQYTAKVKAQRAAEQMTSLRNGVGTPRFISWLKGKLGGLKILKT